MMTRLQVLFVVSPLCLQVAACGNSDKRSVAPYNSGVQDKQAPVSNLSSQQKQQVCESYSRHVEAYVNLDQILDVVCLPLAIVSSLGSRTTCEQQLASCRAGHVSPLQVQGDAGLVNTCLNNINSCNQSVATFEGCVNVNLGAVVNILDNLTCASAENDQERQEAQKYMTASVCSNSNGACGDYVNMATVE